MESINPSQYTTKTLKELRESQQKRKSNQFPVRTTTPFEVAYAKKVNSLPDASEEVSTYEQALERFHQQYAVRKVKTLPSAAISYEDARRLFWHVLNHQADHVQIEQENKELYQNLVKYFICDPSCTYDLRKGIYLWGNIGRGKTYLMRAFRIFLQVIKFEFRQFEIESSREIVFKTGEEKSVAHMRPYFTGQYCFDDFGYEDTKVKLWGNELNIMEEILVNRYDQFIKHGLVTHLTTNLVPGKLIERYKSPRLDSRMVEMFNLVQLKGADKRKS